MENIRVISSDKDGGDLRREMGRHKYHVKCCGAKDDEQINEAIESLGNSKLHFGLGDNWERVFGGK